jgi:dihydroneopterin aldolase
MMKRFTPCTVTITNLETRLRVGIWDHEREFQPIRINLSLYANGCTDPQVAEDLFDCQSIRKWITEEWPTQSHTPLLETKLRELMEFVFQFDARIEWLDAAMSKPEACPEARGVGIRMAISRCDHAAWF